MVNFGSYGRVIERSSSGAFQMVRESSIDCLTVYGIDYIDMCFHATRECTEEQGHVGKWRDRCGNQWKD